ADPASQNALMSTVIGGIGGVLVVFSIVLLDKLKIDDPVGAISVHGTVGIWGVLAVAIFGDAGFAGQIIGLLTIFVWVFVLSLVTWLVLKAIMGVRVSEEDEYNGVDISECGMEAYPEFVSGRA
ncbi:MAG: ammonium transporter, partial [Gammaproteobacteria bacterium]|nr:ammonium transporter [Gammaproteobacteria bacterium]